MFKFTTTTIINDSNGFRVLTDANSKKTLQINHGINIKELEKTDYVAFMKESSDAVNAVCVLDLTSLDIAAGDIYRLALYVKLSGSQNSYYSNDLAFKGKPLYVEAMATSSSATDLANAIVANAKKYQQMVYENQLVTISASSGVITITATDEYQRFATAKIEQWVPDATGAVSGEWNDQGITPDSTSVEGAEGFGTYVHLIKDYRVPTGANTRWNKIIADETPIVGAKYTQFTVYLTKDRGVMGQSAVGMQATSRTCHVFWVKSDLSDTFKTALTACVSSLTDLTPSA